MCMQVARPSRLHEMTYLNPSLKRKEKETMQGQLDVQLQNIATCIEATLNEGVILSKRVRLSST